MSTPFLAQRLNRRVRLLAGVSLLLVACFVLPLPPRAEALPAQSCDCIYYSDATFTVEVGETFVFCNGHIERWGTRTQFASCDCEDC